MAFWKGFGNYIIWQVPSTLEAYRSWIYNFGWFLMLFQTTIIMDVFEMLGISQVFTRDSIS
jgi:hypothetical protein